jgi:glycosyltransferase involved in cell wall biosynthesis
MSDVEWISPVGEPGLVSVIVPVRNRPALVGEALDSVWSQTHRPVELIVVDDGSDDDTPDRIAAWVSAHASGRGWRAGLVRQAHAGAPVARNAGTRAAKGSFIQYLDSDCLLLPDKFARQMEELDRRPGVSHAYGRTEHRGMDGSIIEVSGVGTRGDPGWDAVMPGCTCIAPLWRRAAVASGGPWRPTLASRQDWEFRARVVAAAGPGVFLDRVLCVNRLHGGPRISAHGSAVYLDGTRDALQAVDETLRRARIDTPAARGVLAGQYMAVGRGLRRLGRVEDARRAERNAWRLASGATRWRVGVSLLVRRMRRIGE